MSPERWEQIKEVLQAALELHPEERSLYLDRACSTDHSLRKEVESLLSESDQVRSSFLQPPPTGRSTLNPGTNLGGYEIVSLIGAGGMGEVYRARDLRLRRDVAIKVLPSFVSSDKQRLRRFEQEAQAAAALNHPNILAVHQMGTYEGAPYLVSELLEGSTLRELLTRGPLPQRKAIDFGVQIAHGLAAAHEKGIVHRDLKPENLFVTKNGRVKILDFGLAKLTQQQTIPDQSTLTLGGTEPGVVMGTVGYMSPEQVRGGAADYRADIFAFGAILYEMLTGKRAFQKPTSAETMSAILNEDPPSLSQIVPVVVPAMQRVVQRCLDKSPEQRFHSASDLAFALEALSDPSRSSSSSLARPSSPKRAVPLALASTALVVLMAGAFFYVHRTTKLTDKDIIVLADFSNRTGDPVFDDIVKQALSVDLQQSPFLSILSEQHIRETLKLMGRSPADGVNEAVAREICTRTGNAAVLSGSIALLGNEYVISLNATSCRTGDSLAQEQARATHKEDVLKALDLGAIGLRKKLGESLSTLQKFDTPLVQATTPSLEALKAFSLAEKTAFEKDESAAIPLFKRAIELDPEFALAYAELGARYFDLGESGLAAEHIRKAHQLSNRVSDYERWWIADLYYEAVSGELGKANQLCQLWADAYPRSFAPHARLGSEYEWLGQYENALAEGLKAIRLDPRIPTYSNLMEDYAALNKLSEAKEIYSKALEHGLDSAYLHADVYGIAFLEGDRQEMQRQVTWASGKPGAEDWLLSLESDTHAFYGHIGKARDFTRRAVESDRSNGEMEVAALWKMNSALREAEFGYPERARHDTDLGLTMASGRDVKILAALALARVGDVDRADGIAEELEQRFPSSTVLNYYWLPTIRASNAMHRGQPAEALRILEASAPYELGYPEPQFENGGQLYPAYVRGEAYLHLHQGQQAITEFQKILQHRGIVQNSPLWALAHLGLARAYALSDQTTKAHAVYNEFLTLWKDADPDIPILKQAKAEYAKLQ